jgi:hypothetical protein
MNAHSEKKEERKQGVAKGRRDRSCPSADTLQEAVVPRLASVCDSWRAAKKQKRTQKSAMRITRDEKTKANHHHTIMEKAGTLLCNEDSRCVCVRSSKQRNNSLLLCTSTGQKKKLTVTRNSGEGEREHSTCPRVHRAAQVYKYTFSARPFGDSSSARASATICSSCATRDS